MICYSLYAYKVYFFKVANKIKNINIIKNQEMERTEQMTTCFYITTKRFLQLTNFKVAHKAFHKIRTMLAKTSQLTSVALSFPL